MSTHRQPHEVGSKEVLQLILYGQDRMWCKNESCFLLPKSTPDCPQHRWLCPDLCGSFDDKKAVDQEMHK